MSTIKYLPILVLLLLNSCSTDSARNHTNAASQADIYQELLHIEFNLLSQKNDVALEHSKQLDELLIDNYNLFCVSESAQIDGARMTNAILAKHINDRSSAAILDDLRILKATIINLDTDEDYDPYMAFLWRFEEDMYIATETARDPMLDLYEWAEFEAMVACMNQSWQPVKMHFPPPEMLDHDSFKYKNQTTHKIHLEKAIQDFNLAVTKVDHIKYPICESAEALQEAYKTYIYSFIQFHQDPDFFLAKL